VTLLISSSCSHQHKAKRPLETDYSSDVEKEFSLIEMEQQQALEYYRKLRGKNWTKYKEGTQKKYRRFVPKNHQSKKKQQSKPKPAPIVKKPMMTEDQIKEFEIEIGQNLSYFCMSKRKDRRFSAEADCQAFTQNALDQCEEKVGEQYDRRVLKCLKKKLR
jgi:hypothetical protein